MRSSDIFRLIILAAIWGGSFIFMRVLAPVLGPVITADLRVLIAGLALILYFKVIGFDLEWKINWKHYLIIGVINSGVPFLLYAFAALHIPASYSVILNSTSPMFGVIFSAIWLSEKLTLKKVFGIMLGVIGVSFVTKVGAVAADVFFFLSVAACLTSAICYALAGVYIKRFVKTAKPMGIAGASQLLAGFVLLPFIFFSPLRGEITTPVIFNILGLALVCSAIAYLIYYKLIADVGPTKALTVTFLMPVFGMFWGYLFLSESITLSMVIGCILIIAGTILVVRKQR